MATTQQPTTGHVQHTEVYGEDAAGLPRAVSVTDDGHLAIAATVADKVTVVPETASGVSGRLPTDVSLTIAVGPPAKTISAHPLRGGVSVIGAVGAAAAVSATGKVVTLTAKNDGTTTVTAMQALIAASSSVAPLLSISGTGADLFDAAWSVSETALWAAGTIPAHAMIVLGPDGYWWPVEADSTGGIKTAPIAYSTPTDAIRSEPIIAPPKAVNGPAVLLSSEAQVDAIGSYDMPFYAANYDTFTVSGYWLCPGAETYQLDILARIDDLAAPGDLVNVNALFLPAGVLGVASVGPTTIQVSTSVRVQWREVVVRRTKAGGGTASAIRIGHMNGR